MKYLDKFRSYLLEEEFKMNISKSKINIVNYTSIGHFDSNKVIVRYTDGTILIEGEKLVVSKLLNDEILITGAVKKIELR